MKITGILWGVVEQKSENKTSWCWSWEKTLFENPVGEKIVYLFP